MRVLLSLLVAVAGMTSASAQVTAPAQGSADRKAILDAIRPAAVKEWRAPVVFVVTGIRVSGGYAYVAVDGQRPNGSKIRAMMAGGMGNAYAEALLKRRGNTWTVIEFRAVPSDVWQCDPKYNYLPADVRGQC